MLAIFAIPLIVFLNLEENIDVLLKKLSNLKEVALGEIALCGFDPALKFITLHPDFLLVVTVKLLVNFSEVSRN